MEIKGEISTQTDSSSAVKLTDGMSDLNLSDSGEILFFNPEGESLLNGILKELKIMNLHLSILTDNVIDKEEI